MMPPWRIKREDPHMLSILNQQMWELPLWLVCVDYRPRENPPPDQRKESGCSTFVVWTREVEAFFCQLHQVPTSPLCIDLCRISSFRRGKGLAIECGWIPFSQTQRLLKVRSSVISWCQLVLLYVIRCLWTIVHKMSGYLDTAFCACVVCTGWMILSEFLFTSWHWHDLTRFDLIWNFYKIANIQMYSKSNKHNYKMGWNV